MQSNIERIFEDLRTEPQTAKTWLDDVIKAVTVHIINPTANMK